MSFAAGCGRRIGVALETCEKCGSTRERQTTYVLGVIPKPGKWTVRYVSPSFSTCKHKWSAGIHMAVPNPIPDGVVVLVRQGGQYGAFILENQESEPETTDYRWYFRPFGKGPIRPDDPSVQSGTGTGSPIVFGPFRVSWSVSGTGTGSLHYKRGPGDPISPQDLHLCVTGETHITKVDPADPKWVYKASVSDPGS